MQKPKDWRSLAGEGRFKEGHVNAARSVGAKGPQKRGATKVVGRTDCAEHGAPKLASYTQGTKPKKR